TLIIFSVALLSLSVAGLWPRSLAGLWPRRWVFAVFLLIVLLGALFMPHGIKPPMVGSLIYEKDGAYHYIQVVQDGSKTELILNEGEAIHSIYDSQSLLTGGPWDYIMLGSYFRPAQKEEPRPSAVAIPGLAGRAAARQPPAAHCRSVGLPAGEI